MRGIKSKLRMINNIPNYRYSHSEIEGIAFNGFSYTIPQETLDIISTLSVKVGSPAYIKTPVFLKRDQTQGQQGQQGQQQKQAPVRKRRPKELSNTEWESQTQEQGQQGQQDDHGSSLSALTQKDGIESHINKIRVCLNKISEPTYTSILAQIKDLLSADVLENKGEDNLYKIGNAIFEIASNNKFFSRLYANVYTELMKTFPQLRDIFSKNYDSYLSLFKNIAYVDPDVNYDQFCLNNVENEKRKAVSAFFVNLTLNEVIPPQNIMVILKELFESVMSLMVQPNKTNEVCELIENIAILYNAQLKPFCVDISISSGDGETLMTDIIKQLAKSKVRTYPSLSSKSIFKCMDL